MIFLPFIVSCNKKSTNLRIPPPNHQDPTTPTGDEEQEQEQDEDNNPESSNGSGNDVPDHLKTGAIPYSYSQKRIVQGVPECSNNSGTLGDGMQLNMSQRDIFLRCIFMGGELENCIGHNNCQVTLDEQTCNQELEALKRKYNDEDYEIHCVAI